MSVSPETIETLEHAWDVAGLDPSAIEGVNVENVRAMGPTLVAHLEPAHAALMKSARTLSPSLRKVRNRRMAREQGKTTEWRALEELNRKAQGLRQVRRSLVFAHAVPDRPADDAAIAQDPESEVSRVNGR